MIKWLSLLMCLLPSFVWAGVKFDVPPKAKVEWVSPHAQADGMTLGIRRFEVSSMTVDEVLNFYRDIWKDQSAEVDFPPWKMIGTKQRGEYWNVQVQTMAGGGAWGYLGISDLPELLEKGRQLGDRKGKGFPKMSGSVVIDDNRYKDIGKRSRMLMLQNKFSVASNVSYYRNHYNNNGWVTVMDRPAVPTGGHVLYLSKGSESLSLTINRDNGKTSVVANEVKHGY